MRMCLNWFPQVHLTFVRMSRATDLSPPKGTILGSQWVVKRFAIDASEVHANYIFSCFEAGTFRKKLAFGRGLESAHRHNVMQPDAWGGERKGISTVEWLQLSPWEVMGKVES